MAGLQLIDVRIARELTALGVEGARWVLLEVPSGAPEPPAERTQPQARPAPVERPPASATTTPRGAPAHAGAAPWRTSAGRAAPPPAHPPDALARAAAAVPAHRPAGDEAANGAAGFGLEGRPPELPTPLRIDDVFAELVADRSAASRTAPKPAAAPDPARTTPRATGGLRPDATPGGGPAAAPLAPPAPLPGSIRPPAPAPAPVAAAVDADADAAESIFEELPGDDAAFGRGDAAAGAWSRRGAGRRGVGWGLAMAVVVVALLALSAWLAFAPARVGDDPPAVGASGAMR